VTNLIKTLFGWCFKFFI